MKYEMGKAEGLSDAQAIKGAGEGLSPLEKKLDKLASEGKVRKSVDGGYVA